MNFEGFFNTPIVLPTSNVSDNFDDKDLLLPREGGETEYSKNIRITTIESAEMCWFTAAVNFIIRYSDPSDDGIRWVLVDVSSIIGGRDLRATFELVESMFIGSLDFAYTIDDLPEEVTKYLYIGGVINVSEKALADTMDLIYAYAPTHALIYFRPPYNTEITDKASVTFFSGMKLFAPYGPGQSTRIFLVVSRDTDQYPTEQYSLKIHEEILARHNYVTRNSQIQAYRLLNDAKETDYDMTYLIYTLMNYQLYATGQTDTNDLSVLRTAIIDYFGLGQDENSRQQRAKKNTRARWAQSSTGGGERTPRR